MLISQGKLQPKQAMAWGQGPLTFCVQMDKAQLTWGPGQR